MSHLSASSNSLLLLIEQTPSSRWKTTVRSASNPACTYTSSHLYERVEEAKAAAVRIAGYVWGERVNATDLVWRAGADREESQSSHFAATA